MKKTLAFVAVAVLSIAGIALAQEARLDLYRFNPQWFTRGIYVGPEAAPNVSSTTANRVSRILGGSYTIDFATATITCNDSAAQTLAGARVGDTCIVGPPAAAQANANFTCRVSAADQVIVRYCAAGTAADPASAAYAVTVISNQ